MSRKIFAEVPYNPVTGHMESYPRHSSEWRPNAPFKAALRIVGTERGQSAARFIAEDTETGTRYPMFMTELLAVVQTATFEQGVVPGVWVGCKRGANYGIRLDHQETH